jgi:hypothetical protein
MEGGRETRRVSGKDHGREKFSEKLVEVSFRHLSPCSDVENPIQMHIRCSRSF